MYLNVLKGEAIELFLRCLFLSRLILYYLFVFFFISNLRRDSRVYNFHKHLVYLIYGNFIVHLCMIVYSDVLPTDRFISLSSWRPFLGILSVSFFIVYPKINNPIYHFHKHLVYMMYINFLVHFLLYPKVDEWDKLFIAQYILIGILAVMKYSQRSLLSVFQSSKPI